jgi:glycerophosphoryl diester phosphodiesterase
MREDGWRPWREGAPSALPGLAPVVGHRGAAASAPENTLAGLRRAKELGAAWVEFDVMLSGDGVPVLIHDETLQRTTTGRGRVARHTVEELRRLDAGAWFALEFAGERVPTLAEAVALLLDLGLNANVEIKPASGQAQITGEVVTQLLQRLWPDDGPRLLLSSFERKALRAAQRTAPEIPRGLLAVGLPSDWAETMEALECATLHLSHRRLGLARLRDLAVAQVPVLTYTVNEAARARELLAAGAVAVITDMPDLLKSGASTRPGAPGS